MGSAFSIHEGVHKRAHPAALKAPSLAIGVLAFGFVLEALSLLFEAESAVRRASSPKSTRCRAR